MKKERRRSRSRSRSRDKRKHKKRDNSRSRSYQKRRRSRSPKREPKRQRSRSRSKRQSEPKQERGKYYKQPRPDPSTVVKELPCFQPSGILLQFYNAREYLFSFNFSGVALKFHEPPEARVPIDRWRIYPFKDGQPLRTSRFNSAPILLINQSCFLFGKDQRICDILLENPSISRQHCVIQFRQINKLTDEGQYSQLIKPYILDLQSSNGSFLNGERIPSSRYVQLLPEDRLRFGSSQRQYVILQETDS